MKLAQSSVDFDFLQSGITGIKIFANSSAVSTIINLVIPYVFVAAGLLLLLLILYGGFTFITSATNPKGVEQAKSILTAAIVGFVIVFVAYWVVQLVIIALGLSTVRSTFGVP
ncbi:hypothetical protein A3D00_05455 [Candidatus Woesebacteria bacterium RIFCSPHIGHO2_02_FULL_38_9]|uniref:Uncharacterized protein n=1 Tax=Candidatus Woesebacteria bacterium RIFCSPHIGHO2_01_FULL_39_28 TaxID=1802496 RepID=A0A1F7YL93_9BACT|nr:MAG: hypothetical protein A2627_00650 [Candidatus Woesebacteria bacterium RIFCSPHIGHO2_01_FULL_39_28]OGM33315.1 MAG: hypothetical protein A3D00_05455 [Candidatus Woesebacteria bacterium RIFCSPHIGHO2_02_FULL_38_9]OGM56679.1 MAG: hypothetical protein A3A50_04970 [Candidatus Woesebacteria bacterium RIFCSPLOWO2_01_FULL_38_20]